MPKQRRLTLKQKLGTARRMTGQRRVIADVIQSATDHPDANEVHRRVLAVNSRISLSTVYRSLRLFAEVGFIEQHSFDGGRTRVERAPNEHHDHLIDTESGRVIEFKSAEIERLQSEIARRLGYKLTGHRLELYGRAMQKPIKSVKRSSDV